ncbi:MAG: hypothetical protein COB08_019450 [Rhodobacteraceae bacterium]|nr:hypothetical protein [Paracoccaceae bacterium]
MTEIRLAIALAALGDWWAGRAHRRLENFSTKVSRTSPCNGHEPPKGNE